VLASRDKRTVEEATGRFVDELTRRTSEQGPAVDILGPTACPIGLLRGLNRRHLIVRTTRPLEFGRLLTDWERDKPKFGLPSAVKISVDVDPDDMM